MERQLVRTYSGRLLWLTGISAPDPASERLAASLLSVASLLSLTSLIALVIEVASGWYFGASLFGSLFLPLLVWAVRAPGRPCPCSARTSHPSLSRLTPHARARRACAAARAAC
jgi:hypothetical protein